MLKDKRRKVSVVIPVLNEKELVGKTLTSLLHQTLLPLELILVDGGSVDGTLEEINSRRGDFEKVGIKYRLLVEKQRGIIRARDKGFRSALGSYVFSADADTIYGEKVIQLVQERLTEGYAGVTGYSEYENFPWFLKVVLGAYDLNASLWSRLFGTVLSVRGYHTGFNKKYYLLSGGMDIRYESVEDELGLANLLRQFGKVVYEKGMVARTSDRRGRGGVIAFSRFLVADYWGSYLMAKMGRVRHYSRPSIN